MEWLFRVHSGTSLIHTPDESPPQQDTTMMRDHPDETPPWWETTLMRHHPDERPPWWDTTLMRDHPDERPSWRETILTRDHSEERLYIPISRPSFQKPPHHAKLTSNTMCQQSHEYNYWHHSSTHRQHTKEDHKALLRIFQLNHHILHSH